MRSPNAISKAVALVLVLLAVTLISLRAISPSHGFGLGVVVAAVLLVAGSTLFAVLGFWGSRERNLGLQLAAGAVFMALALLEVFGQVYQAATNWPLDDAAGDRRSLAEFLIDRRRTGEQIYGYFNPVHFGLEGITAISSARVAYCNESGTYDEFDTDAFGFRNPPELLATPGYEPKLAILGDSFALGCGVRPGETIADILRSRLESSTYNAAVGGSGPLQQYAVLLEYLSTLRPRTILWFYFEGNDLWNLQNEIRIPYLRHYFDGGPARGLAASRLRLRELLTVWHDDSLANSSRPLRVQQEVKPEVTAWGQVEGLLDKSVIFRSVSSLMSVRTQRARPVDLLLDHYSDVLRRSKKLVANWGGEIQIVYVPELARYTTLVNLDPASYRDSRERVLARLRSEGFDVIDLVDAFKLAGVNAKTLYPSRLGTDVHLNALGNATAAELVMGSLRSRRPDWYR